MGALAGFPEFAVGGFGERSHVDMHRYRSIQGVSVLSGALPVGQVAAIWILRRLWRGKVLSLLVLLVRNGLGCIGRRALLWDSLASPE